MSRKSKLAILIGAFVLLAAVLSLGSFKAKKDDYAMLVPLSTKDTTTFERDSPTGPFWRVRTLWLEGIAPDPVVRLFKKSRPVSVWQDDYWHMTVKGRGVNFKVSRSTTIGSDKVTVDRLDYLRPHSTTVRIRHRLTWWEVKWVQLQHPGSNPFQ